MNEELFDSKGFKNLATVVLVIVILFIASKMFMATAGPGEVGIKVNLMGDNRGVDQIPVQTGRIFFFPVSQRVWIFPYYVQTVKYINLPLTSKEGLKIDVDLVMAYSIDKDKIPELYVKYRKPINEISNVFLKQEVAKAFGEASTHMAAEDIIGSHMDVLVAQATKRLTDRLGPVGFIFDTVAIEGVPRPPDSVAESIHARVEATNKAIEVENQVRQAKAEAEKEIAKAEGEAKSIRLKADAEAYANRVQIASLGGATNYVKLKQLEKLNPNVQVMMIPQGSMPLLDMTGLTAKK